MITLFSMLSMKLREYRLFAEKVYNRSRKGNNQHCAGGTISRGFLSLMLFYAAEATERRKNEKK